MDRGLRSSQSRTEDNYYFNCAGNSAHDLHDRGPVHQDALASRSVCSKPAPIFLPTRPGLCQLTWLLVVRAWHRYHGFMAMPSTTTATMVMAGAGNNPTFSSFVLPSSSILPFHARAPASAVASLYALQLPLPSIPPLPSFSSLPPSLRFLPSFSSTSQPSSATGLDFWSTATATPPSPDSPIAPSFFLPSLLPPSFLLSLPIFL